MENFQGLKMQDKVGYGIGNMTYGLISQAIATYIIVFGTNILGISGIWIGFAVSLSVIWDAFTDPFMGYISDNTISRRFGRRHIYLIIGLIGMALTNMAIWHIQPTWPMGLRFGLLVALLLLVKSFITIYTTPYTALGAELSTNYHERTSIQGIRTAFFLLGIMVATVASLFVFFNPTPLYAVGQNNPKAYENLAFFSTGIGIICGTISIGMTFKFIPMINRVPKDVQTRRQIKHLFISFFETLKNPHFRPVAIGYLLTNVAGALITTLGLHVYTYTFGMSNKETSITMAVIFALAVVGQPAWIFLAKKIDKKATVLVALSLSILGSLCFVVLVLAEVTIGNGVFWIFLTSILLGSGIGGLFSIPLSMVADAIDYQELTEGKRSEGTYFGMLTLAYKLSQSIAIMIMGLIIDVSGFDSRLLVQSTRTTTMLGLTIGIGCLISFITATFSYAKYRLNQKSVTDIQNKLRL